MEQNWGILICIGSFVGFATLIAYYRQSQKKPYKYSPEALLILGNPEVAQWLRTHLSRDDMVNLRAIRAHFGLDLKTAKDLYNAYCKNNPVSGSLK